MENCYSIIIFPIRHPKQLSQLYACGMVSFSPIAWRRTKDGSYLDLQRIIELMFCTVNLCQLNKSLVQTSPILGPWTHICTVIIISITLILIIPLEYLSRWNRLVNAKLRLSHVAYCIDTCYHLQLCRYMNMVMQN